MIILALNPGSSSLKYGLYNINLLENNLLTEGKIELKLNDDKNLKHSSEAFISPLKEIFEKIKLLNFSEIQAIGCRVVHGGSKYYLPTIIDLEILTDIEALKDLAPLHNQYAALIMTYCFESYPKIPIVAVFDTAFHHNLPKVSANYAIPKELAEKYKIRRYGFHGLAHQGILKTILKNEQNTKRIISCHLGNGASICAIKDGKSIDTSMGFTPLEGLLMGTRSGDIDPGLIIYLIKNCGISPTEIEHVLTNKSGLLGLSELSSDLRELEAFAQGIDCESKIEAKAAIEAYVYRIVKYIGAYYVALEGLDVLTFSGGIGENSILVRELICKKLAVFGIEIFENLNLKNEKFFCVSTPQSLIKVLVVQANENLQIVSQVRDRLNQYD